MRQWQHVQLFSPWRFNFDHAAERLLLEVGWERPEDGILPTGEGLLEAYLAPLARHTRLANGLRLSSEVIDASGTWATPNPAGANGLPALGEREASNRVTYGMPNVLGTERQRFENRRIAVLGGGHSAVGTILEPVSLLESTAQTSITWLVRAEDTARAIGRGTNDQIRPRGQIGARFRDLVEGGNIAIESGLRVNRLSMAPSGLQICGEGDTERRITDDELGVETRFRPDFSLMRELRLYLDATVECPPVLAPLIDPNPHSSGTARAPTFLMITGYEQVRSVIAALAGDVEAAAKVELQLPETGVCSAPLDAEDETGCCEPNMTKNQPSVRLNLDRNRQL